MYLLPGTKNVRPVELLSNWLPIILKFLSPKVVKELITNTFTVLLHCFYDAQQSHSQDEL